MVASPPMSFLLLVLACGSSPTPYGLRPTASQDVLVPGTPGAAPQPRRTAIQGRTVAAATAPPVEVAVEQGTAEAEVPEEGVGIAIDRPAVSPTLFGRDLASRAQDMQRYDSKLGEGAGLDRRSGSLAHVGTAEAVEIEVPDTLRRAPGEIDSGPVAWPKLTMPPAKPCLSGAVQTMDEQGSAQEGGLSPAAVRQGVDAAARHAYQCFPEGVSGAQRARAWLLAGCDGRVSDVKLDQTTLPTSVVGCIEHTLKHASLPAHGLPDGQEVLIPLTFRL